MATIQDELQFTSTDATEVSLPIAGTGSRSYAFLIDWHIRLILAVAWLIGSAFLLGNLGDQGLWEEIFGNLKSLGFYVVLLPTLIIYGLYHPVLEIVMKGRTPGKRAAGIRVVTLDGQTPDVPALLIRNVFRLVDSLPTLYVVGLISVLITERHVRIGDMAAGTLLVHEKKLTRDAFQSFAREREHALDLPVMEVADDLLKRWRSLEPEVRTRIAIKLLASQGETLPPTIHGRALEHEVYRRLTDLTHAKRD